MTDSVGEVVQRFLHRFMLAAANTHPLEFFAQVS
jgi:hypothetical protein